MPLGCGSTEAGTETGNPEVAALTLPLVASSEAARIGSNAEPRPTELLLLGASLSVSSVSFIRCDQLEVAFEAIELALLGGEPIALPEGQYCSARIAFPKTINGSSNFQLTGIRTTDDADYAIELSLDGTVGLERPRDISTPGAETPIEVVAGRNYFLVLDIARVLPASDETVGKTPLSSQGQARIDAVGAPELAARLAENLRASFSLVSDANENGTLELVELEVPLLTSP